MFIRIKKCLDICQHKIKFVPVNDHTLVEMCIAALYILAQMSGIGRLQKCTENVRCPTAIHALDKVYDTSYPINLCSQFASLNCVKV